MVSYFSLVSSFSIFLLIINFLIIEEREKNLILFIFSFAFLFLFSFDYKSGVDWYNYMPIYQGSNGSSFEVGYVLLSSIFGYFGVGFWFFSAFVKLFFGGVFLWLLFSLKVKNKLLVFIVFYFLNYHSLTNVIRQELAMAFLFLSVISFFYFDDIRKFLVTLLFVIFATSFHYSAFIFIFIFIIFYSKVFRVGGLLFVPLIFVLFHFNVNVLSSISWFLDKFHVFSVLNEKLNIYMSKPIMPISIGTILRLFLVYFFVIYSFLFNHRRDKILLFFMSGSIAMLCCEAIFFQSRTISMRMGLYFNLFFILYWSHITLINSKFDRWFLFFMMLVYVSYNNIKSIRSPLFIEHYSTYRNSIFIMAFPDEKFENDRDRSVNDFWLTYSAN